MEPTKCTHYNNYENIYLNVPYDFSKFNESNKSRCDGS